LSSTIVPQLDTLYFMRFGVNNQQTRSKSDTVCGNRNARHLIFISFTETAALLSRTI